MPLRTHPHALFLSRAFAFSLSLSPFHSSTRTHARTLSFSPTHHSHYSFVSFFFFGCTHAQIHSSKGSVKGGGGALLPKRDLEPGEDDDPMMQRKKLVSGGVRVLN